MNLSIRMHQMEVLRIEMEGGLLISSDFKIIMMKSLAINRISEELMLRCWLIVE